MPTRYAAKHGPNLVNTINAIIARDSFDAGNLWGAQGNAYGLGQLSSMFRELYLSRSSMDLIGGDVAYTVFSYRTPIAWYDAGIGEWVFPDYKYSPTTTAHQSVVRRALSPAYISDATAYAAAIGKAA